MHLSRRFFARFMISHRDGLAEPGTQIVLGANSTTGAHHFYGKPTHQDLAMDYASVVYWVHAGGQNGNSGDRLFCPRI